MFSVPFLRYGSRAMVFQWMRRLSEKIFGSRSSAKASGCKRQLVWLGVESLERRELMSATVPGFTLNSGNLYNTSISQTKPIDTGVQQFTVVNSKVYDLHTNGNLDSLNNDGSGQKI